MRRSRRSPVAALALVLLVGLLAEACTPAAAVTPSPSLAAVPTPVPPTPPPSPTPIPTPAPTPVPTPTPLSGVSVLTGLPVDPMLAHRTPVAVMIDDARAARPQSGFNGASVVFQSPADGYETRYLMIYGEGDSPQVGPVRSARFFLVQWSIETASIIGHYGGDRKSRRFIRYESELMTDVDALGKGAKAFHRIKSRRAPHNGYTSTKALRKRGTKLGAPELMAAEIRGRAFTDPSPVEARAARQTIRVPYNTNVITWTYDRASNLYRRSVDGRAQIDPADGKRVTATNVVVLFQKFRIDTRIEPGHARPVLKTTGKGVAWIYREGRVTKAFWSKARDVAPTLLVDADGKEIPLIRGRTFFQVVPKGTKVAHRAR
jgi:hypothetical protein